MQNNVEARVMMAFAQSMQSLSESRLPGVSTLTQEVGTLIKNRQVGLRIVNPRPFSPSIVGFLY